MTGRVIDDDLFGIARRLKSIDDGYFVFFNYKTKKFEIHNAACKPSLCLVLPFDRLDERTVVKVRRTRAERVKELIAETERENERLARQQRAEAIDKAAASVSGAAG